MTRQQHHGPPAAPVAAAPPPASPQAPEVSSLRLLATLSLAGAVAGLLVVTVYRITLPAIEKYAGQKLESAVREVLKAPVRWDTLYLVGAALAALAVYDMTKALSKEISIERLELVEKTGGKSGEGKLHLESDTLLFRGEFRVSVTLSDVSKVMARNGTLTVEWSGGKVGFMLGADADKWARAITNPKNLMEKMGVKPGLQVAIVGRFETNFRTEGMNALGRLYLHGHGVAVSDDVAPAVGDGTLGRGRPRAWRVRQRHPGQHRRRAVESVERHR